MENKDGQQKNGKRYEVKFRLQLRSNAKQNLLLVGKQKNGKQKWKTNNTIKIITYLQVK